MVTIEKPPLADVLEAEGVEVLQRGGRTWCRCPVHEEKTPSFLVEDTRGHCFACQFSGDAVDLVMKLHGLDFKRALRYLGIRGDRSPQAARKRAEARKKREAINRFRRWCNSRYMMLSALLRALDERRRKATRGEVCAELAEWYHAETKWLYEQEILDHGTDKERLKLYREVLSAR